MACVTVKPLQTVRGEGWGAYGMFYRYRAHMTSTGRDLKQRTHFQGPCSAHTVVWGLPEFIEIFFSKFAGAGRNRNCRNICRNLPVVSGAGRFEVGPRAGFGQVLAFWPVLASFASKSSVL